MPHIPTVFCGCGHEMEPTKNGEELAVFTDGRPYYAIQADQYTCNFCDCRVSIPARREHTMHHDKEAWQQAILRANRHVSLGRGT